MKFYHHIMKVSGRWDVQKITQYRNNKSWITEHIHNRLLRSNFWSGGRTLTHWVETACPGDWWQLFVPSLSDQPSYDQKTRTWVIAKMIMVRNPTEKLRLQELFMWIWPAARKEKMKNALWWKKLWRRILVSRARDSFLPSGDNSCVITRWDNCAMQTHKDLLWSSVWRFWCGDYAVWCHRTKHSLVFGWEEGSKLTEDLNSKQKNPKMQLNHRSQGLWHCTQAL